MQKVKGSVIHLGILTQSDEARCSLPSGSQTPSSNKQGTEHLLHPDPVSPAGLLLEHVDDVFHQQVPLQPVDSMAVQ